MKLIVDIKDDKAAFIRSYSITLCLLKLSTHSLQSWSDAEDKTGSWRNEAYSGR